MTIIAEVEWEERCSSNAWSRAYFDTETHSAEVEYDVDDADVEEFIFENASEEALAEYFGKNPDDLTEEEKENIDLEDALESLNLYDALVEKYYDAMVEKATW